MRQSFDEELDRREYWCPRNVGFGNYCWGYHSRAPSHQLDSSILASPTSSIPFTTKS